METDLSLLISNFNRYVVTPLNAFGIGGFVFDIEGETTVNLSTEITDHYLEDNTTVQDHIAVKPKKITLKSYVGELVHRQDETTDTFVQKAVRKLTTVNQYLPDLATQAKQIWDNRKEFQGFSLEGAGDFFEKNIESKTINRVTDYWAMAKNLIGANTRQQQAYMYFKALMEQKLLVSVQTPFEYMNRMAIESITAIQSEDSKYISDFSITLKEIRVAQILNVPAGDTRYVEGVAPIEDFDRQGRSSVQYADDVNLGNISGLDSDDINPLPITIEDLSRMYDFSLED